MKEVRREDLPGVHGGAEVTATAGDTLPFAVVPLPAATISDSPTLPPTLPEKHVET